MIWTPKSASRDLYYIFQSYISFQVIWRSRKCLKIREKNKHSRMAFTYLKGSHCVRLCWLGAETRLASTHILKSQQCRITSHTSRLGEHWDLTDVGNILNTSAIMCYDGDVFPSDNSIATTTIFLMEETGVETALHI